MPKNDGMQLAKKALALRTLQIAGSTQLLLSSSAILMRRHLEKHRLVPGLGKGRAAREPQRIVPSFDVYERLCLLGDVGFLADTRFTRSQFDSLLADVKVFLERPRQVRAGVDSPNGESDAGRPRKLSSANQLLLLLKFLVGGGDMQSYGGEFGLLKPYETIQHALTALLLAIGAREIAVPSATEQLSIVGLGLFGEFDDVVGVTDGTYSQCQRGAGSFSGSRGLFCRTTQGTIVPTGPFMAVESGIPGGEHDSLGMGESSFYEKREEILLPGTVLFADKGYKGMDRMYTDFECKTEGKNLDAFQRYRSSVEHAFSKVKQLFTVVKSWNGASLTMQAQTVVAACALYNRLIRLGTIKGSWQGK